MEWFNFFLQVLSDLVTNVFSKVVFAGMSLGSIIIVCAVSGILINTFVSRGAHA